jgi:uncharacterized HAD superfamily protein
MCYTVWIIGIEEMYTDDAEMVFDDVDVEQRVETRQTHDYMHERVTLTTDDLYKYYNQKGNALPPSAKVQKDVASKTGASSAST